MIPYGRQNITSEDIKAVTEALQSDFLTQGPAVPAFESAVGDAVGAAFGVAVNSATSALHIACLALGIGRGSRVWTSPITFVASANCALYCGADVDFVDIDSQTYNLSIEALTEKLVEAEQAGTLPDVLIPVHLAGQSCDMKAIADLAERFNFKVIEDASHAIGADYAGLPVGNCRYSDITVFSFHPVKIITTGEGGMAVTQDEMLANTMARLRSHGITRDPAMMTHEPDGDWYYQQQELGFNYRMTDLQAALGVSQMKRLSQFIEQRRALAERYFSLLSSLPVTLPYQAEWSASAWHLYILRIKPDLIEKSQKQVFKELREAGIGVNLHYIPVHLQPYYAARGFAMGDFPAAEKYYTEAISIPLFHGMTEEQQNTVANVLEDVLI